MEKNKLKPVECVLPLELLEQVFQRTDPTTFLTIINACIAWNDLMRFQKVESLLPLVFPHVMPFLEGKDIISLRKVCTSFKTTIDFFLQYGPFHRISDESCLQDFMLMRSMPLQGTTVFQMTTLHFYNSMDIERFMKEVCSNNTEEYNPFPGRSLHFAPITVNANVESIKTFELLVKQMIRKHGKHIWRLSYRMPLFCTDRWLYQHMAGLLKHLENLRCLVLDEGVHWLWNGLDDDEEEEEEEIEGLDGLRPVTFPPLPKLLELRMPLPKESVFHGTLITILQNLYGDGVRILTLVPPQAMEESDFEIE